MPCCLWFDDRTTPRYSSSSPTRSSVHARRATSAPGLGSPPPHLPYGCTGVSARGGLERGRPAAASRGRRDVPLPYAHTHTHNRTHAHTHARTHTHTRAPTCTATRPTASSKACCRFNVHVSKSLDERLLFVCSGPRSRLCVHAACVPVCLFVCVRVRWCTRVCVCMCVGLSGHAGARCAMFVRVRLRTAAPGPRADEVVVECAWSRRQPCARLGSADNVTTARTAPHARTLPTAPKRRAARARPAHVATPSDIVRRACAGLRQVSVGC
jgi:hypothetical protein